MQKGFLAAVVEDCCADEPNAHKQTLERYTFIFERTMVGLDSQASCRMGSSFEAVG